ncbi:MAG: methyltransferase domain-containing protein [Succinivibrionaceae bacterium]
MQSYNSVISHFNKGAKEYLSTAKIQVQIAKKLLQKIPQKYSFNYCIDLGCGPGVNFLELKKYANKIIGIDISPNMIEYAKNLNIPNTSTIVGNIEDTKLDNNSYDLLFSSLALQWVNLEKAHIEIKRIATNNSFIALALPIDGTLIEFNSLLEDAGIYNRINTFTNTLYLNELFSPLNVETHSFKDIHYSIDSYLKSIRAIGANINHNKTTILKSNYKKLMNTLENHLQNSKELVHTYNIAFIYGHLNTNTI